MKRRRMPPLAALRVFECAARHLSFTRAAEELSVTQAAVSHQIKALEEWFGCSLFDRGGRAISLTKQGAALAPGLTSGFDHLESATLRVSDGKQSPLRIATLDSFIAEWLMVRLRGFMDKNPGANLRFVTASQEGDALAIGEADVEIRYGEGNWQGVEAIELFREDIFPVCSPALLKKASVSDSLNDLNKFALLHDVMSIKWEDFLKHFGARVEDTESGLGFSNSHLVVSAAISGYGVALGRALLVANALREGTLVRPWPQKLGASFAYYLVYRPEMELKSDIADLIRWFREEAELYKASETSA